MLDFFASNFSSEIWLAVIIISMLPALESRVSIPFGLSLIKIVSPSTSPFLIFICAFIGSIFPAFSLILSIKKMKRTTGLFKKTSLFFSDKYQAKLLKVETRHKELKKLFLLAGFVAIPAPLTGVWSGSVIAGLSTLPTIKSFFAITIGSFISCLLIFITALFFGNNVNILLIISIALAGLFLLIEIFKAIIKHK